MITRISGIPRVVNIPIDQNAIIEEATEKKYKDLTVNIILNLLRFLVQAGYVVKHVSAWITVIAVISLLSAPANAAQANPTVSLNAIHNNWIWQHQGAALLNPEILLLVKTLTPCDLIKFQTDIHKLIQQNQELCKRTFPTALDTLPHVNVTTASDRYITLNGRLTLHQATKQCQAIGSSLVTAKTQEDAANLYGYMVDHRINETFSSITLHQETYEPTFGSDGTLANGDTTVFKKVHSARNWYPSTLSWNEVLDQYKKDHFPVFFTYGATKALTIAVFAHRETAPYEQFGSGGTGTTIRLKAICNIPTTDNDNPKIESWRAGCETNLRRNRRIADSIINKIDQILPNRLPKTTTNYPSILQLNQNWDDKKKIAKILNIMGYTWDPILPNGARPETKTTPPLFQKVYGQLLEESTMTIKARCAKWLADSQTAEESPKSPPNCLLNPISINSDTGLYGCDGAVFSDKTPSPRYCRGGKNGEYPFYRHCCKWTGTKCVPKQRKQRNTNPDLYTPISPNSTDLHEERSPRYAAAIAAGARLALSLAAKYAKFAWPAVSASASLGSFFVDLAPHIDPQTNGEQEQSPDKAMEISQQQIANVDFNYATTRYDNLKEANAFTEASFLEVTFLMTIHQAAKFADDIHNSITSIVHTRQEPDVTQFLSLEEFEAIRKELLNQYAVVIPSSMDTIKTTFTYTKNSYIAILAVPRQTDTSSVDIYKLLPLPLYEDFKTYMPTSYPPYVALTYKGEHVHTPLTEAEARVCSERGICEASTPTSLMYKAPCGVDSVVTGINNCIYTEIVNESEGTFRLVDNHVYYAVTPNSSLTLKIQCRGSQQRGVFKKTITLREGYGNFTLKNQCTAHWGGYVLTPAKRRIDVDAWIPTEIGPVYREPPPHQTLPLLVSSTRRFPTKWGLAMQFILAAAAAMIIALAAVCVMGHTCPVTLISCCSSIGVRDIAKLFRHIDERNEAANPPQQNPEALGLVAIVEDAQ